MLGSRDLACSLHALKRKRVRAGDIASIGIYMPQEACLADAVID